MKGVPFVNRKIYRGGTFLLKMVCKKVNLQHFIIVLCSSIKLTLTIKLVGYLRKDFGAVVIKNICLASGAF